MNTIAAKLKKGDIVLFGHNRTHGTGTVAYRMSWTNDRFVNFLPVMWMNDKWESLQDPRIYRPHNDPVTFLENIAHVKDTHTRTVPAKVVGEPVAAGC